MHQESEGFICSKSLTKWVRWFLYIQIFVAIISLISGNMEYQLLSDYQNGVYTSQDLAVADGEANDKRQRIIAIIYFAVFIISGIIILKWIYRANYNARQLGAKDMKFTPGWSVGWYFIPVFWLWKPYQAMKEIWKASYNPIDRGNTEVSAILPWWWFFWLINNFLGQAVMRMSAGAVEISELKNINIVNQLSDVTSIILALITLKLVIDIYQNQIAQLSNHEENKTIENQPNPILVNPIFEENNSDDEIDLFIEFLNKNPSRDEIEKQINNLHNSGLDHDDILMLLEDRGEIELARNLSVLN